MKCLKLILISSFLVLPFLLTAQKSKKLERSQNYNSISKRNIRLDRSVDQLLEEASELMGNNNSVALDKVQEALAISITDEDKLQEAKCYLLLGSINQNIEEWDLSVNSYQSALIILESSFPESLQYVEALSGMANSYEQLERYSDAISVLDKKLNAVDISEDKASTYLDLADNHLKAGNYENTEGSLDNADDIISKESLQILQIRSQAIRAKLLAQQDNVDEAVDFYQQSQSFNIALDSIGVQNTLNEVSLEETKEELINAYSRQNRVDEEIQLRNQSIADNSSRGRSKEVSKEKVALSKTLIDIGNTSAAIKELEDAAVLASKSSDPVERASAFEALGDAYFEAGNTEESVEAYRNYRQAINEVEQQRILQQQEKEGILKKQQDIFSLSSELALDESRYNLQENQLFLQRIAIYGLLFLLFGAFISVYFILKNARKSKTMSEMLALKSLRSQMNPHFIFNALNSVNQFIAVNDERAANKFLSDFSKLMRLVLDNSQKDFITLAEEQEIISLYLKLEHNRFRDKFNYTFEVDDEITLDSVEIPPMLIQPYIENAIWHGLRYKEEIGQLDVRFSLKDQKIIVEIADNGIGRKKSAELKTTNQKSHKSTGISNTQERVSIINKVYHKNYNVSVSDLNEHEGTLVTIELPQNTNHHE
ncbi:MAG: histidine kinase [bacterium]|nr:histidine kinase [bacterium]